MNDHTLGDGPIEDAYRAQMTAVAKGLDEIFNGAARAPHKATGFVLLVFPFGSRDGRANFISNGAKREDIVTLFREMIARFEGMPGGEGHG